MRYRDRCEADLVAVACDVRSHALWIECAAAAFLVSEHHALGDAVTTAAVFLAMATKSEKLGGQAESKPVTVRSLVVRSAKNAY